jgi:16S rRNA (guanine527-N7)-methyltransferase
VSDSLTQPAVPSLSPLSTDLQPYCHDWSAKLHELDWPAWLGWQPDEHQLQQFERLYEVVLTGNAVQNLTRLTEPDEFLEKHLWDSLRGLASLGNPAELTAELHTLDIGSGAGFPGLPMAIAFPSWQVTLLDSTRRKVSFLTASIEALQLTNARAIANRVELLPDRDRYDLATLRAIGPATVCAEYCLPLLKVGGRAILYRGRWTEAEVGELEAALAILGGEIAAVDAFATPITQSARHCVVLRKTTATPAGFPRAPGVPARSPLGGRESAK